MANFSPGCNFSPASETNPLKNQIVDYIERDSARAENPSPVFANRARIFSPAKQARKSEKISCNRNGISARAEKQETIWLPLGSGSDFSEIKAIKERILSVVSLISKLR